VTKPSSGGFFYVCAALACDIHSARMASSPALPKHREASWQPFPYPLGALSQSLPCLAVFPHLIGAIYPASSVQGLRCSPHPSPCVRLIFFPGLFKEASSHSADPRQAVLLRRTGKYANIIWPGSRMSPHLSTPYRHFLPVNWEQHPGCRTAPRVHGQKPLPWLDFFHIGGNNMTGGKTWRAQPTNPILTTLTGVPGSIFLPQNW